MRRCPSPSLLSLPSPSSVSSSSFLSVACLFLVSFVLLLSSSSSVLVSGECVVSPSAWVLLRFNLRTGGDTHGSSANIQIEVDNTTVALLQEVKTKLAVVSIIGPYRTGKSTLLNRLLPPNIPPSVFSVGHTVQPHTEEVSVYVIPPCALQDVAGLPPDTSLVFVDTPGLFAPNRVNLFDAQLLAVLNLISSVVVYNNVGVIKRVEVEQNLQVDLKDRNGESITTKAYIQSVLNEIDSTSNSSTSYSSRFNRFFASLDSFALPFPSTNFKDAQRLNEMKEEEFTQEYREEKNKLKARTLSLVQPKRLGKNLLQGRLFAQLITSWTENVNIPIDTARENSASALMRHINQKEVAKSLEVYKSLMRQVTLPVQDSELRVAHDKAVAASLVGLNLEDLPDFMALFQHETDALYTEYVKLNEGNVRSVLEEKLSTIIRQWKEKVDSLAPQLPLAASVISAAEKEAKDNWAKTTEGLRVIGASLVGDYDIKVKEGIEGPTQEILLQSLRAYKAKRKEDFEAALTALTLPVQSSALVLLHKTHADEWANLLSLFNVVLPKAASDPDSSDFAAFSAERLSEFGQRNDQASVAACGAEAMRLSRQMMREAESWYQLPRYSSLALLSQHVKSLKESEFCVGAGLKNEGVLFHFNKAKKTIGQQIEQRATFTQIAFIAAAFYALRAAMLCWRMVREKGKGAGGGVGLDLLGEKEALLGVVGKNGGAGRVGWVDRCWVLGSVLVAGVAIFLESLMPDAAEGLWLNLLYSLVAILVAIALVGFANTLSRACRGSGKSSHEH